LEWSCGENWRCKAGKESRCPKSESGKGGENVRNCDMEDCVKKNLEKVITNVQNTQIVSNLIKTVAPYEFGQDA